MGKKSYDVKVVVFEHEAVSVGNFQHRAQEVFDIEEIERAQNIAKSRNRAEKFARGEKVYRVVWQRLRFKVEEWSSENHCREIVSIQFNSQPEKKAKMIAEDIAEMLRSSSKYEEFKK